MELPEHIWLEICQFLAPKDLCQMALVNQCFHLIASNNYTWEAIVKQRHTRIPRGVDNLKKNYADINCQASHLINKYQSDIQVFEKVLDKERLRQKRALEEKKIQRQIMRSLKQLEGIDD
jgi:hypothetical protein